MKKRTITYISIAALFILLVIAMLMLFLKKNIDVETFENHKFYQYFSGERFDYEGDLKISKENDITELKFKDVQVTLDSTPIYYADEKTILLPKSMSIIYPKMNVSQNKVNYFSKIYDENGEIYLSYKKKNKLLKECFFYDGRDLYMFIEPVDITINGEKKTLSPMSYVIVDYGISVQIYDYKSNTFSTIPLSDKNVIVTTNVYTVNLSIDSVAYNNNSRLLIKKVDILNNIEW